MFLCSMYTEGTQIADRTANTQCVTLKKKVLRLNHKIDMSETTLTILYLEGSS